MMKDIVKHKLDYSVLALLSGGFITYFLREQSSPINLVMATVIFSFSYLIWGLWHHSRLGGLTRQIVLEYFLVGILGIVIVSSLLIL